MRKLIRWGVAGVAAALLLAGCVPTSSLTATSGSGGHAGMQGMTEFPIGAAKQFDSVQVSAFYSKPADMEPTGMGLPAASADIHLEGNVTALQGNNLGFAVGAWIPYVTVDYEITTPDGTVSKGTLMPMTSAHGQHYGANVKMGKAGTYTIKYTVHSPAENGLMVHVDKTTGVDGRFWDAPLVATWGFDYLPREW